MKRLQSRLLLLAGFLLVFPLFLRRRRRVERHIAIMASPEEIFPYFNDLRNWPLWTEWGRRDAMAFSYGAQSLGEGAVQRWRNSWMSGEMRIVRTEENARIDYEVEIPRSAPFLGRILLQKDGACTRVTWRCVWEMADNPYRRYFDLLIQKLLQRDFASSLERLKSIVEND